MINTEIRSSSGSIGSSSSNTRSVSPRRGGPKEARLNRTKLMETGRYFEAATVRGDPIQDIDSSHTLRINNLFRTTEDEIRKEFEGFGALIDVYRPVNKDNMKKLPFLFVRFVHRDDMLAAMCAVNGKEINGRKMEIVEAKSHFELETNTAIEATMRLFHVENVGLQPNFFKWLH